MLRLKIWPKFGGRDIIGIDSCGSDLKLVHARVSSNRVDAVSLFTSPTSGLSDADISKAIKGFLTERKIKITDAIGIIPSHMAITKNIEIPSCDPQEIKEIVNLQSGRHTPYSREEIIVDYLDIGSYKDSYTKVLLVMVARNIIKRQFDIMYRAGLRIESMFFAAEGTGRFISKFSRLENEKSPAGIVHINKAFTDFIVVFKGRILYVRSIPIGVEHLTKDQQQQARFVEEIKNSLESYSTESIEKMPNNIILTGSIDAAGDLEKTLNATLHIPARSLNYLKHLPLGRDVSEAQAAAKGVSFLDVCAPFFSLNDIRLNLIPEEVRLKNSFEEKSRDIVKSGILALTAFVFICCILISNIYFKNAYFKALDAIFQKQYPNVQKVEGDFDKVRAIKEYLFERGYSLEVLSELYSLVPGNIRLSEIKFDEQDKLSIKGTAKTMASVFLLVDSLEKSKYFKDVTNRYATKRKEEGEDVADFEILCSLEKKAE